MSTLTFNDDAAIFILKAFGKSVSSENIIIDDATGEPILTPEGEELTLAKFGGIKKGSEIFIKNDLLSAMNIAENTY